jgi:hypothetical protein
MTEGITLESTLDFLQEATGFRLDQTQADTVRLAIGKLIAEGPYAGAPPEAVATALGTLNALGVQLMDRLRTDPSARLDGVPAKPVDLTPVTTAVGALRKDVLSMATQFSAQLIDLRAYLEDMDATPDFERLMERIEDHERVSEMRYQHGERVLLDQPQVDLGPVKVQLETLAKLMIAAPRDDVDVRQLAADVKELCEDVAEIRTVVAAVAARMPDAYIALQAVRSDDASPAAQETSAGGDDHFVPQAVADALDILRGLNEQDGLFVGSPREPWNKGAPGCVFNEDGTITCKVCGVAKDPLAEPKNYYRDKASATGYKSRCVDCERTAKGYAAKVSRAA